MCMFGSVGVNLNVRWNLLHSCPSPQCSSYRVGCAGRIRTDDLQNMNLTSWPLLYRANRECINSHSPKHSSERFQKCVNILVCVVNRCSSFTDYSDTWPVIRYRPETRKPSVSHNSIVPSRSPRNRRTVFVGRVENLCTTVVEFLLIVHVLFLLNFSVGWDYTTLRVSSNRTGTICVAR